MGFPVIVYCGLSTLATVSENKIESDCDILIRPEKNLKPFIDALKKKNWRVKVTPIPIDFVIFTDRDTPIAVERKTTWDFVGSIKSNHLVDQLKAMREISDDCYILLESSWAWVFSEKNKYRSNFNQASVVGFIDAVDKFGVKFIPVNNKLWSIMWIDKKLREFSGLQKKQTFKLRSSASRDLSPSEQAEYIVSGFPGLGPSGLDEVKAHFPSASDFLNWVYDSEEGFYGQFTNLSTRVKNLRKKWRDILEAKWNGNEHKT